jgi:hypothetical protein
MIESLDTVHDRRLVHSNRRRRQNWSRPPRAGRPVVPSPSRLLPPLLDPSSYGNRLVSKLWESWQMYTLKLQPKIRFRSAPLRPIINKARSLIIIAVEYAVNVLPWSNRTRLLISTPTAAHVRWIRPVPCRCGNPAVQPSYVDHGDLADGTLMSPGRGDGRRRWRLAVGRRCPVNGELGFRTK